MENFITTGILTGTVKRPGELPHEYLFITKDNKKTRIREFVYYRSKVGGKKTAESSAQLKAENLGFGKNIRDKRRKR